MSQGCGGELVATNNHRVGLSHQMLETSRLSPDFPGFSLPRLRSYRGAPGTSGSTAVRYKFIAAVHNVSNSSAPNGRDRRDPNTSYENRLFHSLAADRARSCRTPSTRFCLSP